MSKKQVIEAKLEETCYGIECPDCEQDQTFFGSEFNENYECVHCEHEFIVKLPEDNKHKQALQAILDAIKLAQDTGISWQDSRMTPVIWDAIEEARKVMEVIETERKPKKGDA